MTPATVATPKDMIDIFFVDAVVEVLGLDKKQK